MTAADRRRAELAQRHADQADLVRVGLAPAPRSHADIIAAFTAGADAQDRIDDARSRSDRELRDRDLAARRAAADADRRVAVEQRRAEVLGRSLSTANRLIGSGYQA